MNKILFFTFLLFFTQGAQSALSLDCKYGNNKKFQIEVSEILISSSYDSYYHEDIQSIYLEGTKSTSSFHGKTYSCEKVAFEPPIVMTCIFANNRTKNFEVKSFSFGALEVEKILNFQDHYETYTDIESYLLIDERDVFDYLHQYKEVGCSISF